MSNVYSANTMTGHRTKLLGVAWKLARRLRLGAGLARRWAVFGEPSASIYLRLIIAARRAEI